MVGGGPDGSSDRQTRALTAGGAGTWEWNRRTGVVVWDAALEALYGLNPGTFGGRVEDWLALINPEDRDRVLADLDESLRAAQSHYLLFRVAEPRGTGQWIESRGRVLTDEQGVGVGMIGVCHDVTDRQEDEMRLRAAEQQALERLQFLAEAGQVLTRSSIELDTTLQELTSLSVPKLADWCAIDLVDEAGGLRLAAVAHADDARVRSVREMVERYGRSSETGAGKVVRTGVSVHLPEITDELLQAAAHDEHHLAMMRELDLSSALVVPLSARGRTLGALTLAYSGPGRRYDEQHVSLAESLAARAAVAIDNAQLFRDSGRTADMLQQALLPPHLPNISGMELASLYDSAGKSAIGGDFYDAMGAESEWTLMLGDVCGKGTRAAALTSLARHTMRAAALQDPAPAHVLELLNDAMLEDEADDSYCTALCARLRIGEDHADLEIAAGGHPYPLILRADGDVEPVEAAGMPLGLFAQPDLQPVRVRLGPGDLLFCYTDGLDEARDGDELFGMERIRSALRETLGWPAEATVKHIQATVEAWRNHPKRDDTAMLACRVRG